MTSNTIILDELKRYSQRIGGDISLVQGPGGNVSYKQNREMWIKASGTWLKDAISNDIFACVDVVKIRDDFFNNCLKDLSYYNKGKCELRPSIETLMHAIIDKKIVIHLHPIDVLYYAVLIEGEEKLNALLSGFKWQWIEYNKPGYELAKSIAIKKDFQEANVFILENHGIIISGDTIDEVDSYLKRILSICFRPARPSIATVDLTDDFVLPGMLRTDDPSISSLAFDEVSQYLIKKKILYPDQVVFLGLHDPIYNNKYIRENNLPFIVVPGIGTYVSDRISKSVLALLKGHSILLSKLSLSDNVKSLTDVEISQLVHWDAEKYRKSLEI